MLYDWNSHYSFLMIVSHFLSWVIDALRHHPFFSHLSHAIKQGTTRALINSAEALLAYV